MSGYGPKETWKVVYNPKHFNGGMMGVALVEAATKQEALRTFSIEYAGQYSTVDTCTKLLG